jgi:hypothetical protein
LRFDAITLAGLWVDFALVPNRFILHDTSGSFQKGLSHGERQEKGQEEKRQEGQER